MIPVTKPYLPPIEKYENYLSIIYKNQWLTNNGPLVKEYEDNLKRFLKVSKLLYVTNGTIALQLAIKALELSGEIITTPFSYVATTTSIIWEGCAPVFVDIDPQSLNIDPSKIEEAITHNTSAILATHCFGNPCDIDAIEEIAKRNGLKVIYDGAHGFGTNYKGKSLFNFGDVCTGSLHATKLVHSVEGGIVSANDDSVIQKLSLMRNFGHNGPEKFEGVGINGKNSEFHAAMGLCVLDDVSKILERRKLQSDYYDLLLSKLPVRKQVIEDDCTSYNHSYYPIIFPDQALALKAKALLEADNIFPRRYFYPSLSSLDYIHGADTPHSDLVAQSILCLPLFFELTKSDQEKISNILRSAFN